MLFDKRQMMYKEAFLYLLDMAKNKGKEINEKTIRMHLEDRKTRKPMKINGENELFYKMIDHAKNKQSMPKIVGNLNDFKEILCNFDPKKVLEKYNEYNEPSDNLLDNIGTIRNLKKINRKKGYWVGFSKSILSIAEFLSRFNTIHEFNEFVDIFNKNDDTRIALVLLLDSEIYGYGFALACDFLKENCNPIYVKPDIHIKKLFTNSDIIKELGLPIKQKRDDEDTSKDVEISKAITEYFRSSNIYEDPDIIKKLDLSIKKKLKNKTKREEIVIFRAMMEYSRSINKLPYEVDKLFWLVGSGYFYLLPGLSDKDKKIKTSMDGFIERVLEKFRKTNVLIMESQL